MTVLAEQFMFDLGPLAVEAFLPRYNIAPTQCVPLVRLADGERQLAMLHWGLIPPWAKDKKIAYSTINARGDSVATRALEKYPGAKPRIISDNGPQFIARDFKEFIRLMGMTHVRTSPYYPQSNGKLERWHGSLKRECIRPAAPASLEEARRRVADYVEPYNHVRLNSAIG